MPSPSAKIIRLWPLLILLILAGNTALAFWSMRRISENEQLLDRVHELIETTTEAMKMLTDAETGERGFVITGEDSFVVPYEESVHGISRVLDRLEGLLADNPGQRARLEQLKQRIDRKMEHLAAVIQTRREQGFEAASMMIRRAYGKREMDAIRAIVAEMRGEEEALLRRRAETTRGAYATAVFTNLLGAFASVVLIGLLYVAASRGVAERVRARSLEDADRRKDEFLAILAHEQRNPLAAIQAAIDSIRAHRAGDQALQHPMGVIEQQVHQLSRLVEDLLDTSRIARGKLVLRKEVLDISSPIAAAVEMTRSMIQKQAQRIDVLASDVPLLVDGDRARLTQVFSNLLSNASRYSPPGHKITISATREAGEAVVRVQDEGRGIAREMLPRIFDLYTQEDRNVANPSSGLGIGLAVVRRIVEMLGGSVQARSEGPGSGSEFTVRLPLCPADAQEQVRVQEPEQAAEPANRPSRILLADDCVDFTELFGMLLKSRGHIVEVAHDGAKAVETARSFHPDVVLLDLDLPTLDGYEVAARLRGHPESSEALLVALSGRTIEERVNSGNESRFDYHLTKPVRFSLIEEVLSRRRSPPIA